MPLFEYRCSDCGYVTTFLEKIGERVDVHKCGKCSSEKTEKIFSKISPKKDSESCPTGTCPFS